MIGNRLLFVVITLFLVITVSTAPVDVEGEEGPETTTILEEINETTAIPDVVTDDLLFLESNVVPIDKSIKLNDNLLYYKNDSVIVTPEPDVAQSFTP